MSNRLVLHIGTHKTATTSVQHFFSRNRRALRSQGIFYPSQDITDAPSHYAHLRIAHAIAGEDNIVTKEAAVKFFDKARELAKADETILVSAEPFYRHKITPTSSNNATTTTAFRAYAEAVKATVGQDNVKIMVMLRRQDLFAESLYGEHILSTGYKRSIKSFIEERRTLLDYKARLEVWADVFGQDAIMLKAFEQESLGAPIERVFVEWLGGQWTNKFDVAKSFNPTIGKSLIEYKRRINSEKQPREFNTAIRDALTRASKQKFAAPFLERDRYYLPPKDRHDLLAEFEDDNRELAQTYLGSDTLFKRSIDADTRKFRGDVALTDEEFEFLTRNIFRLMLAPN